MDQGSTDQGSTDRISLDRASWAGDFARVALDNITRDYPYAAHHTTSGPDDTALPVALHPAFATSYDWHSSVHMHWLAARLVAFGGDDGARLEAVLVEHLGAAHLSVEAAYLADNTHYERPYGWAWGLRLAAEITRSEVPALRALAPGFAPFVDAIAANTLDWVAKAAHPVRHGVHSNSAFGLLLILEAARVLGRDDLTEACETAARSWFGDDRSWPFDWERSGQDFLSAGFAEADLMRAVLPPAEFAEWAVAFFASLEAGSTAVTSTVVVDASDAQQVHLFGLNLSRAGAAFRVAGALQAGAPIDGSPAADLVELLGGSVEALLAAGLEASVGEEYYSTHWLASFAWDAMEAREGAARHA